MKVAVIGSRNIHIIDLKKYLPGGTNEIISGGAKGVDLCAKFLLSKTTFHILSICLNTKNTAKLRLFAEMIK